VPSSKVGSGEVQKLATARLIGLGCGSGTAWPNAELNVRQNVMASRIVRSRMSRLPV